MLLLPYFSSIYLINYFAFQVFYSFFSLSIHLFLGICNEMLHHETYSSEMSSSDMFHQKSILLIANETSLNESGELVQGVL